MAAVVTDCSHAPSWCRNANCGRAPPAIGARDEALDRALNRALNGARNGLRALNRALDEVPRNFAGRP